MTTTPKPKQGEVAIKKPKTVELVKSTYQPTKAEKDEEFKMDHPGTVRGRMDALAKGLLQPILTRWIDRPRSRRSR